jgi:hypothetical protein
MAPERTDFLGIGFEDFRRFALDSTLSDYEKIGFPDSYRRGFESLILADLRAKLPQLDQTGQQILDIGPGCSELPRLLIEKCRDNGHSLHLVDSAEMLGLLPDEPFIDKVAARFPDCPAAIAAWTGRLDAVICYSVLHYLISEVAFFRCFDICLSLLAPGGHLLFGDIPNISKRKRFFASETGVRFHQEFMQTTDPPQVEFNRIEFDQLDDAILVALLLRARSQGFDAYLLPQHSALPMANRREDLLIVRP